MTNSQKIGPHIDEQVVAEFKEYIRDTQGKVRGNFSEAVENAMIEYMDNDRYMRIEDKLDTVLEEVQGEGGHSSSGGSTHTHIQNGTKSRGTTIYKKCETIASELTKTEGVVVQERELKSKIMEVSGSDDRTIEKHKKTLRSRGVMFKHPSSPIWFTDREEFFSTLVTYTDQTGTNLTSIIADYPQDIEDALDDYLDENADGEDGETPQEAIAD